MHDHDAVGERHRLDLVMRHIEHVLLDALAHQCELGPHLPAQLGVEVGQGLVEEEDGGVAHQCAAHGDALALAAGERRRLAVEQMRDREHLGDAADPRIDLRLRHPGETQREGHVLRDIHVGVESVILEHHRDVPVLGIEAADLAIADPDLAPETSSRPATMRSVVDLPQPDGPTSTVNSLSAISRSRPSITLTGP